MRNLILLIIVISISGCDCGWSSYSTFTVNYERNVPVSKEQINSNIGKAITLSESFYADIGDQIADAFVAHDANKYMLDELSLYYFWMRKASPNDQDFEFIESVIARISFNGYSADMSSLTIPGGDRNFKLTEPSPNEFSGVQESIDDFTVSLSFVPKSEVQEDIVLQWDFTLKYKIELAD